MPFASRNDLDLSSATIQLIPRGGIVPVSFFDEEYGLGSSASIYARNKARWDKYVMTGDNGKPFWYMKGPDPWVKDAPNNMLPFGSASWVTWIVDYVRAKKDPSVFPEPPFDAPVHGWSVWAQAMFRNFGLDFVPEPPKGTEKYKVWADARYRATHTGGFLGGVARTFRQIGGIVITAVGAVLAPFTGGASLAAASIATAAIKAVNMKQAATAAKSRAAADAAQIQAEADRQQAALALQVDKFYSDNKDWFLQHGVTSDKWAKLTLDQKVELINAGAAGKWPDSSTPVSVPPEQQIQYLQQTAVAAQQAGIPPASVVPEAAAPLPPSTGKYEIIVEGQKVGEATTPEDASKMVLANAQPGQRFEVYFNGQSTGLQIMTSSKPVGVDPRDEAKVRALTPDQMGTVVKSAEKKVGTDSGGGLPWWLILAGAGTVAVVAR